MKGRVLFWAYRSIAFLVAALVVSATALFDREVSYIDLLVAVIGTAGVVVTVFGIWVAVIFPRFVASLGGGVPASKTDDAKRYQVLLKSLYRAALVLVSSLFVLIIVAFLGEDSAALKGSLCAFVMLSFISLSESLFVSIVNGELAASDAINEGIILGVVRRRRRAAAH